MAKKATKKPNKTNDLMEQIRSALDDSRYDFRGHALERLQQREVTESEAIYVLKKGRHEKKKDEFDNEKGNWKYAVRGKTVDNRELRVIVAFVEPDMFVITVIDLETSRVVH